MHVRALGMILGRICICYINCVYLWVFSSFDCVNGMRRLLFLAVCVSAVLQLSAREVVVADNASKESIPSAKVSVWISGSDNPMEMLSDNSGRVFLPDNVVKISVKKFGYEDKTIDSHMPAEGDTIKLDLGYILKEVSVSAIKNHFRIKSDSYVYDVAADSALIGKSTFDALGRIPILNTTIDGSISSMQGKQLVYKVNGLANPLLSGDLQTALRSLKAEHVKRIELKNNPNGSDPNVLEVNIITKGRLEGYQANATTHLSDYAWRTSLWGLSKINNFCVSGAYYFMMNRDHDDKSSYKEDRDTPDSRLSVVKESEKSGYRANYHNAEVSMSYDIDDMTIISAFGRILAKTNPYSSTHSSTVIRSAEMADLVSYDEKSKTTFDDKEYSANLNFERIYGENAQNGKLFIGYDFYKRPIDSYTKARYDVTLCNDLALLPSLEEYDRREFVNLTMHTAMIEYRRSFLKKHTVFVNATYRFRSDIDNDSLGSNIEKVKLRQHMFDGNVAYKFAVDKFSLNCGIGAHLYHDNVTNSKYGSDYSYSRHNLVWQPTLSLSLVPNYKTRYELSYVLSSSIPGISVMNPFVFQVEPTHISYGNPRISPERSHKLVLSNDLSLDKLYIGTSLSGAYTSDIILQYSFLDENNVLNTTYNNIAERWNAGLSTFLSWNITRKTSLRTYLSLDYIHYNSRRLDFHNSGLQFNGNITLSSELPFGIYGELRGNYNSPWINFQGKGGANFGYGISLVRSFLSNKLRVSLTADNFAPTYYRRSYTTNGAGFTLTQTNRQFHAYYALTVSYAFGNIRARVKETESSISNSDIKGSYDE